MSPDLRRVGPRVYGLLHAGATLVGFPLIALLLAACLGTATRAAEQADAKPADAKPAEDAFPFSKRVPAPEFEAGLTWFNTEKPVTLESLRGKFVVLDFWTYCCINCMHILPELEKLEQAYPKQVVVIGVHSAKFDGEKIDDNIREAILRHRIAHPVVNDSSHAIWNAYAVSSWPSLRIIDPEGQFIAGESGEVTFEVLDEFLGKAIPHYRRRGTLDETPSTFRLERLESESPLRFPGKVLFDEGQNRLIIADSGNNRIVVVKVDPKSPSRAVVEAVIGSGQSGRADGDFASASFRHPQGMAISGKNVLWIADTENHLLRRVDLAARTVDTIAGTGEQARGPWPGTRIDQARRQIVPQRADGRYVDDPAKTPLNSPWDLCVHGGALYIAMAGPHQIWRMPLDASEIGIYAGNGREDIVDGKLLPKAPFQEGSSSFAQPSGLASDGERLFVADSEGSSIRIVPLADAKGMVRGGVRTLVGTAELKRARLFTFGDVDGEASAARLQHPLGVAWHDGTLYVADTYNGKIKAVNPSNGITRTVAEGEGDAAFDEPAGIASGGGLLWVADTNRHRIVTVNPANGSMQTVTISPAEIARAKASFANAEPARTPEAEGQKPIRPGSSAAPADGKSADEKHLPRPALDPVRLEPVRVAPQIDANGVRTITLAVKPEPPKGWKINELLPLKWEIEAVGAAGPIASGALRRINSVSKPKESFPVTLPLEGVEGKVEFMLLVETGICSVSEGECRPASTAIRIPVTVAADGNAAAEVKLPLPRTTGAGGIPGLELFR